MNELLSLKRVASFERLLTAFGMVNGGNRFDALDGGAGSGSTAQSMLKRLGPEQRVHAFEPFPGNHRFFESLDPRIVLHRQALTAAPGRMTFRIPSVVSQDSEWGRRGMVGYSSVGFVVPGAKPLAADITVECVAADDAVPDPASIGFIKLDLQGGELGALKGMQRMLPHARLMWIEFTCQPGLLEFLGDNGFSVYDTEYLVIGDQTPEALAQLEVSRHGVPLSTGRSAWLGFRRRPWVNYELDFKAARSSFGLVQTDLVCINRRFLDEFIAALSHL